MGLPDMRYFKISEFLCPCCLAGEQEMDHQFLLMLDRARDISGVPFVVTSGFRCEKHNRELSNAVPDSWHLLGLAADISVPDDRYRGALLFGMINAGFRRIGVGKTYIHVDHAPLAGVVWIV